MLQSGCCQGLLTTLCMSSRFSSSPVLHGTVDMDSQSHSLELFLYIVPAWQAALSHGAALWSFAVYRLM